MPETLEELKDEINKFCTTKKDSKSCIAGVLQGTMLTKQLMKKGREELVEELEDYITKKLV